MQRNPSLTEHHGRRASVGDAISAIAVVAAAVVTVRVIRVSHGRYPTQLALIGQEKTLSVIFGSIAPVIPYIMIYLAALLIVWMFQQSRNRAPAAGHPDAVHDASASNDGNKVEQQGFIATIHGRYVLFAVAVTVILVIFVTTSIGELLFASIAVAILFTVIAVIIKLLRSHPIAWLPAPIPAGQPWQATALLIALAAFLVVQLGFDDSMWAPAEVVIVDHRPQIVYVLGSSGPSTEAIFANSRNLVQIPTSALITARFCAERHGKVGLEAKLSSWPNIYQLFAHEPGQGIVSCQALISTEERSQSRARR